MPVYVVRDGVLVDKKSGQRVEIDADAPLKTPMIVSDIEPYHSPIDDRLISSNSERREDLKRNNCVPYEPSMSPTKGRYRNPSFTEPRGLKVSEDFL